MSIDSKEKPPKSKAWRRRVGWLSFAFLAGFGIGLWQRSLHEREMPFRFLSTARMIPNDSIGGTFRYNSGPPWTITSYALAGTPDGVKKAAGSELVGKGWTLTWSGRHQASYQRRGDLLSIKYDFRKRHVLVEMLSRADGGPFEAISFWFRRVTGRA